MGLKHPHEVSSDNAATMPDALDQANYTLLSYHEPDWGWAQVGGDETWTISNSLQVYDIAALQYLYGTNSAYNLENTVYAFDAAVPLSLTIWDAGGVDLLDFSQLTLLSTVSLEPGSYSTVPFPDWTPDDNLGIAFGTIIENVIGTSWDNVYFLSEGDMCLEFEGEGYDTIVLVDVYEITLPDNFESVFGSNIASTLRDNDADNVIFGGQGNDIFWGEVSSGIFIFDNSSGKDKIMDSDVSEVGTIQFISEDFDVYISYIEDGFKLSVDDYTSLIVSTI